MGNEPGFLPCMQIVCDIVALEATAFIDQWCITDIKFKGVEKDNMSELFYANDTLKGMKVIRRQNMRTFRYWIQDQEVSNIDLELLIDDIL